MNLTEKLRSLGYDAVAVVGPTASGKTAVSLVLADQLGGEIISCDSMQIYKEMDIGTAKATEEERSCVPHHLIDVIDPDREYSAADYVKDAYRAMDSICVRGNFPIFCGGTGLYLESVMRGEYPEQSYSDAGIREELFAYARENGNEALHAMLCEIDPCSAQKIHKNNVKRVVRAIEIAKCTGSTKSDVDARNSEFRGPRVLVYCLCFHDRDLLYSRIERRVDKMIEEGLVEEARRLLLSGKLESNRTAMQAIGYKELLPFLRGEAELCECVSTLKTSTRRYAKRQLTWFLSRDYVHTLFCDTESGRIKDAQELVQEIAENIKKQ